MLFPASKPQAVKATKNHDYDATGLIEEQSTPDKTGMGVGDFWKSC